MIEYATDLKIIDVFLNQIDENGNNALFYLEYIDYADYEKAKLLISSGINVDIINNKGIKAYDYVSSEYLKELILHAPVKSSSKSANKR